MKEVDVRCMNCGIVLFNLLVKQEGNSVCYQANCPVCGGKSFKKRVCSALFHSPNFTLLNAEASDVEDDETFINIVLEKL